MNAAMMMEVEEVESDVRSEVDVVGEIRLRIWARKNYAAETERDEGWHPVVLDEMLRIDREG